MATTYLEIIQKIQAQTLENIKQIQAVQLATLATVREVITELPTTKGLPTFAQITELGSSFASKVLDQQKTFTSELGDVIAPAAEPNALAKSS